MLIVSSTTGGRWQSFIDLYQIAELLIFDDNALPLDAMSGFRTTKVQLAKVFDREVVGGMQEMIGELKIWSQSISRDLLIKKNYV